MYLRGHTFPTSPINSVTWGSEVRVLGDKNSVVCLILPPKCLGLLSQQLFVLRNILDLFRVNRHLKLVKYLSKVTQALSCRELLRHPWKILFLVVLSSGANRAFICERDVLGKLLPGEWLPPGLISDFPGIPHRCQEGEGVMAGYDQQNISILSYVMINYACWLHRIFPFEKRGHLPLSIQTEKGIVVLGCHHCQSPLE